MKTFKDLEFKKHQLAIDAEKFGPSCQDLAERFKDAKHAVVEFDNGWGLSVIFGKCFYSNGVDTYECAISNEGRMDGDVLPYQTKKQVESLMKDLQQRQR